MTLNAPYNSVHFQYGLSNFYGKKAYPSYEESESTHFLIDNLQCGTLYHYRAVSVYRQFLSTVLFNESYSYGDDKTFTTLPCSSPPPSTAPIQWSTDIGGNGHWYERFNGQVTWDEARRIAKALGGELATITSEAENNWVYENLFGYTYEEFPIFCFWLGGSDEQNEGNWTWVTGEPWQYAHWMAGEPSNNASSIGKTDENYLAYWNNSSEWNDLPRDFRSHQETQISIGGFIVEYEYLTQNCTANYSQDGQLHIPCVSVPNPVGGTTVYEVDMQQKPPAFIFEVDLNTLKLR
ncbi:conserved hypothetical protein [Beggiatoa sp. PS]|nr:conserved hypothetical protein [Beggiatoa sp. PS]